MNPCVVQKVEHPDKKEISDSKHLGVERSGYPREEKKKISNKNKKRQKKELSIRFAQRGLMVRGHRHWEDNSVGLEDSKLGRVTL